MQKLFPKKLICFSLIFVIFSGMFLVNIGKAEANPGILEEAVKSLLQGVSSVALHIAQAFTGFVGNIFKGIVDFGFQQMDMVKMGWTITRDIVNMFFILALVVIAFATILRIETYGIKTLLPKLILIALLINFSYVICGLIIDATQITATYFVKQIETEDIAIAVLSRLRVVDAIRGTEGQMVPITDYDTDMVLILTTAFSAIVVFAAGFVMLVGAILLFIRVGALWALIILSPFAWFFSVFPGKLKGYADQWWGNFLKWAFFAPIYIFFIFLVLKISEEGVLEGMGLATGETAVGLASLTLVPMFGDLNILFRYVFLIILLFGAPVIATSMGIKSAGAAQKFVKGTLKGTAGIAYKLPGGLRKTAATIVPPAWMEKKAPPLAKLVRGIQKTAAFTSPEFWKTAREARKAERLRKARLPRVIGKMQDIMNLVYSLGSEKTSFAEQAEQFEVAERKKEIEAETKRIGSRLIAKRKQAFKQKHVLDYKACTELLQEQGDTNDSMIFDDLFDDFKYDDKYALDSLKGKYVNDPENRRFSNLGFKHGTLQQMRQMGVPDKQIAAFLGKMQEIGLNSGYFGMYGMSKADEKGNWLITTDEEHMQIAAAKLRTQTGRMRNSKLHGTALVKQGADKEGQYAFVDRDEVGDALFKAMTPVDIAETEMRYVRPDTQTVVRQAYVAGALKEIPTANALGEKFYKAMTGEAKKTGKGAGTKAGAEAGAEEGQKTKKWAIEEIKEETKKLEKKERKKKV